MITHRRFLPGVAVALLGLSGLGQTVRVRAAEAPMPRIAPVIGTVVLDSPDFDTQIELDGENNVNH